MWEKIGVVGTQMPSLIAVDLQLCLNLFNSGLHHRLWTRRLLWRSCEQRLQAHRYTGPCRLRGAQILCEPESTPWHSSFQAWWLDQPGIHFDQGSEGSLAMGRWCSMYSNVHCFSLFQLFLPFAHVLQGRSTWHRSMWY